MIIIYIYLLKYQSQQQFFSFFYLSLEFVWITILEDSNTFFNWLSGFSTVREFIILYISEIILKNLP